MGYPPNTLFTVEWAIKNGAKAIEYDVVLASDNHSKDYVVMIEPKIVNSLGLDINNLIWEDIEQLDAGNEKFGKLSLTHSEDVLQIAEDKLAQQIQLKGDQNPNLIPVLLKKLKNTKKFIITAFDIESITAIKKLDRNIRVGWLVKPEQEKGSEGTIDLTALVTKNPNALPEYADEEINTIIQQAKKHFVDILLLCGPRIKK